MGKTNKREQQRPNHILYIRTSRIVGYIDTTGL